jgi:hypothetical protein
MGSNRQRHKVKILSSFSHAISSFAISSQTLVTDTSRTVFVVYWTHAGVTDVVCGSRTWFKRSNQMIRVIMQEINIHFGDKRTVCPPLSI